MNRRAFLGTVAFLAAPVGAKGQERLVNPRIAFLGAESPSTNQHFLEAFRQGLREHGYVDGRNITIDERWADGRSASTTRLTRALDIQDRGGRPP